MTKVKKVPFPLSSDETVAQELITVNDRERDAHYDTAPSEVTRVARQDHVFFFYCATGVCLEVNWVSDQIVRFRYSWNGTFEPEFSYAVDPHFQSTALPSLHVETHPDHYLIASSKLRCIVEINPLSIHLSDNQGQTIFKEKQGFYTRRTILRGMIRLAISIEKTTEDLYYGLGEKACSLCLNGKDFENWNTDSYSYQSQTDPLYKSIPFFYGLRKDLAYGVFLDNTYRSRFDFGKRKADELHFEAAGGEMRYYFIYGPQLLDVAREYSHLTGAPELPPIWALGFHQSRWSYFPDKRVREVARTFREKNIPCDAIYLDIDYMHGFRCFTWDQAHFPDPKKLISEFKEMGFHTVVMIDPGIKIDPEYAVYRDGMEQDVFCYRTNGDLMTGPVWPQECVFPDYTNPRVREWWGMLYKKLYLDQGVAGFWNDMNEPAVFKVTIKTFPDEVRHDYDGQPTNHQKAHNIYGQQMARATYEGLKKLDPARRPFVLTRATFAGGQRHAATWTGDNMASWEHLQIAHRQTQRLSICGFGFSGSDIGGFMDEPDGELMLRWLQMGVFHPFFRIHSMGNNLSGGGLHDPNWVHAQEAENRLDQEPWAFGAQWEALNRQAIELRYQWLPYLYTCFWTWIQQGTPMLKSLVFYDQTDPLLHHHEEGVWIGPHVLVFPVFKAGQKSKTIYLPKGIWLDYQTGKHYEGGKKHRLVLQLDRLPILVAAGAVLPHHPVRANTTIPAEELILRLYPGPDGVFHSTLYEDEGEGYGYSAGIFLVRQFTCEVKGDKLTVRMHQEGAYSPPYKRLRVQIPGRIFENAQWNGETVSLLREKGGTTILLDPFPGQGKDPGFELLLESAE
ncbi:MAG: DUF4968 domain-containing protein [Saprospirales bacterium]|nr:DUF4968 domain-containing protein [Saprospirales bacterium]